MTRCMTPGHNLEKIGDPRSRKLSEVLKDHFNDGTLWETFGIVAGVTVCLGHFVSK